jgi:hypothetical protein
MNRRKFLKYIGLGSLGGAMVAKSVFAGPMRDHTTSSSSINVKDFGAVGDGVTDDTPAIQAAIDSKKGPVYIPPGDFVISQIELPNGMVLFGASSGSPPHFGTELRQKPGTNLSLIVPKSNIPKKEWWHWVSIKNIHMRGDPDATAGCGIEATRSTGENFRIENVLMVDFAESGFRMTRGSTPGSIENCAAFGNGKYGFDLQRKGHDLWNSFTVNRISGDDNGIALVRVKAMGAAPDQVTISNVKSETHVAGTQQDVIVLDSIYGSLVSVKNVSVIAHVPMNSVVKITNAVARVIVENFRGESKLAHWIDDTNAGATKLPRLGGLTAALVSGYWDSKGVGQTKVITN